MPQSYALIGCSLGRSLMPVVCSRLFELAGLDARFSLLEIPPQALEDRSALPVLAALDGFHIASPHKARILPLLDSLDESAQRYRCVSAVRREGTRLVGTNTEIAGLLRALAERGLSLEGRVGVAGLGGLGRMFAAEAARAGARVALAVLPAELEEASTLAARLRADYPGCGAEALLTDQLRGPCDLLVNATATGMAPRVDEMPVPVEALLETRAVFDSVYTPSPTLLIREAARCGCTVAGGAGLLIHQAAASVEFWTGRRFRPQDLAELASLAESLATVPLPMDPEGRGSLLFCGFPGCGKKTVGRLVAKRTGRRFVNLAEAVEARCGQSTAAARQRLGDARFAQLEQETLTQLCAGERLVVAAGGSTLTCASAIASARGACRVLFLDTPLDYCLARMAAGELPEQEQGERELCALYGRWQPLYRWASHHQVDGRGTAQEVAEKVLAALR